MTTSFRDLVASFSGQQSLERKFSGGDSYGGVFERNGDWYCTWNGTEHGPFPSRAAAMEKKMMRGDSLSTIARDALTSDANLKYKVRVRQLATGSDFVVSIFSPSQARAEERAKELAMREYKISPDKMRELNAKGIAVFRIVSSEIDPNQTRFGDSLSDIARDALSKDVSGKDSLSELIDRVRGGIREQVGDTEYQVDLEGEGGRRRGVRVQASSEAEAKKKAEADNDGYKADGIRKIN